MSERYDVIIVGSGAGGSTLAYRLARTGKRILIVERGERLPREPENWNSREVFVLNRYKTTETWLDRKGRTLHPQTHYCVGGNTKVYGAALFRLRAHDFLPKHGDGPPAPAWPIGYAEFAPYYLEAERLYSVHGQRGADPTEPPCSNAYPHPPISHEPIIQRLFDGLTRAGHRPFPLPLALLLDEAHPEHSACVRCPFCDGFPCPVRGKADAEVACLEPALGHGNVALMTGTLVERVETDATGRSVTGLRASKNGEPLSLEADVVVLSCGAINSAALLLRSANAAHPDGLANGSGVVGRHFMSHNNSALLAFGLEPNGARFQKTLGLNDFYGDGNGGDALGHVQMLGKADAGQLAGVLPVPVPDALLGAVARHTTDFWLMSEDFPDPENRVTVEPSGQIRLSYGANNQRAHHALVRCFSRALNEVEAGRGLWSRKACVSRAIPLSGVAHQCGTVRFGRDPKQSALDVDCRAHQLDNLYVVDGSFFPSCGAVNPTLTIIANALRVGDAIAERLR